jgi:hypothetical protein
MLGSSRVAAQLAASQEGLSSMSEWVNSFLAFILQLPTQFLCSQTHILAGWHLETGLFFITTLYGPHIIHSLSVVGKALLQRRCIATEVIRFLLAYSLPREFVYRVVT